MPVLQFFLASVLLLLPCFWQSRIQAGDLSSHIYNAWLTQLIERGGATGLVIAPQRTNVLADLMLSGLLSATGAGPAQRITVAVAVLVFVWGAFAFVCTVARRRAWNLLPAIAILAYGWTFHMGFLNFYLSLGLCFFAMAVAWKPDPKRLAGAAALLLAACVAHSLAVVWAVALLAYRAIALRLEPRRLPRLALSAAGAILVLRFVLASFTQIRWAPAQLLSMTAADQAWVYDDKYQFVLAGVLVVWVALFFRVVLESGANWLFANIPFHFCLLTAIGVFVLPTGISIPGYAHSLTFIADRMSLALGICYCAVLAAVVRPPAFVRYLLPALALLFFGFLYRDDRVLNGYEDRMQAAVAQLPGQRVVTGIGDPSLRINAFTHMIDRACLGVCYSYANYEPSTGQFRVRVVKDNPFVASTYNDSWLLQNGAYAVQAKDLPLYRVEIDPNGRMVTRPLTAGAPNGMTNWDLLK